MKYKVGDKIRIKPKEWWEDGKNKNEAPFYIRVTWEEQFKYCGLIGTITKISDSGNICKLDLDEEYFDWRLEMFEGLVTDKPSKENIISKLTSAIIEAAKQAPIIIEQTEDGGVKISPIEDKEEDLPIDTPVMCADELGDWMLRFYARNGNTYVNGRKSDEVDTVKSWKYVIEFSKFNPNNIEESLKYNIVK